jgi:hypothetical protein
VQLAFSTYSSLPSPLNFETASAGGAFSVVGHTADSSVFLADWDLISTYDDDTAWTVNIKTLPTTD